MKHNPQLPRVSIGHPRTRAGVIAGLVAILPSLLATWVCFGAPLVVVAMLAGIGAGYLACTKEMPASLERGAEAGGAAASVAGAIMVVSRALTSVLFDFLLQYQIRGAGSVIEAVRSEGAHWIRFVTVETAIALLVIAIAVASGAVTGYSLASNRGIPRAQGNRSVASRISRS